MLIPKIFIQPEKLKHPAVDIYQDRNDVWTMVPFLKHMEKQLGFRYPSVTADSGYESEEAYETEKQERL